MPFNYNLASETINLSSGTYAATATQFTISQGSLTRTVQGQGTLFDDFSTCSSSHQVGGRPGLGESRIGCVGLAPLDRPYDSDIGAGINRLDEFSFLV